MYDIPKKENLIFNPARESVIIWSGDKIVASMYFTHR